MVSPTIVAAYTVLQDRCLPEKGNDGFVMTGRASGKQGILRQIAI
jgi:hypothetical protein